MSNYFRKLLCYLRKLANWTFFRYVLIGGGSYLLEISLLFILVHFLNVWYVFSNIISTTISLCFSFLGNNFWTFKLKKITAKRILLLLKFHLLNLVLFSFVMFFFTSILGVNYIISKILVTLISIMWSFFVVGRIIYR